jgi:hypothetical protein
MLRVILEDYFNSLKDERAFDVPFITLLAALGFYDIHITHGPNEKGKDVIAKFKVNDQEQQWVFQSKCGDITKSDWTKGLLGQMLSCEFSGIEHPSFNSDLPRQSVIVATGKVKLYALNDIDSFNKDTLLKAGKNPLLIWDRLKLIDSFVENLEATIELRDHRGISHMGEFLSRLGDALKGTTRVDQIEVYSRSWYRTRSEGAKAILNAASESAVLGLKIRESVSPYEALQCRLAFIRCVVVFLFQSQGSDRTQWYVDVLASAIGEVNGLAEEYFNVINGMGKEQGGELSRIFASTSAIVEYPVTCSRLLECLAMQFFLAPEEIDQTAIAERLEELVLKEDGCCTPISDRYAVSIVWACLALCLSGRTEVAEKVVRKVARWVCDKYMSGFGLAGVSSDAHEEIAVLLGYPFESVQVSKTNGSLLATAVCDMAAYIGNPHLYEDICGQIKAAGIHMEYFQCDDSISQFEIDGLGVAHYPSVYFSDTIDGIGSAVYADHIRTEPPECWIVDGIGPVAYVCVSMLLRDRYFPLLWRTMGLS